MPVVLHNPHLEPPEVKGPKTHLVSWRGGEVEFVRRDGNALNSVAPTDPPWYVVRYRGKYWGSDEWHYCWLDYGGPPQVFLTRRMAEMRAREFRKQYGGGDQCGGGPLKVEVVKIEVPE